MELIFNYFANIIVIVLGWRRMVRRRRACGGSSTGRCSCASCVFNLPPPPFPLAALPQPTLADALLGNANFTRKPVWAATIVASFACRDLDNRLALEDSSLLLLIFDILTTDFIAQLQHYFWYMFCDARIYQPDHISNICSYLCMRQKSICRHVPWMINTFEEPVVC